MATLFEQTTYVVRKQVIKLFGASFHIYDPSGQVAFYSHQKAFRLKEDIRLYTGEDMKTEVLVIKARQAIDFAATYDVYDAINQEAVGSLRRRGLKSLVRDEWLLADAQEREIGRIREDRALLALVRRLAIKWIPQHYHATIDEKTVCTFKQQFNPFVLKLTVDFTPDAEAIFDRRLGVAAALLLCAIEGRQS